MSHDLLELRTVHGELVLKILDVQQKILRQFVQRPWEWRDKINSGTKLIKVERSLPLRDGGCLGPIPTMMEVFKVFIWRCTGKNDGGKEKESKGGEEERRKRT